MELSSRTLVLSQDIEHIKPRQKTCFPHMVPTLYIITCSTIFAQYKQTQITFNLI